MQAIGRHLSAGGQVIVFLNRRGYAPSSVLQCLRLGGALRALRCAHDPAPPRGAIALPSLRRHAAGARAPAAAAGSPLNPVGQGTERVEETLARLFPPRPSHAWTATPRRPAAPCRTCLDRVHSGEARILVGTQMLTKGHHFPDVSLVVILDADQGLFASDFRATERLAQTITQVAGRAGRAARPGEVLIQTAYPEHPLLTRLITDGYDGFASSALEERRQAGWPPYSRLAMLRAEARNAAGLDAFLRAAAAQGLGAGDARQDLGARARLDRPPRRSFPGASAHRVRNPIRLATVSRALAPSGRNAGRTSGAALVHRRRSAGSGLMREALKDECDGPPRGKLPALETRPLLPSPQPKMDPP